jgi:two-component sensor histidine kinase
MAVHELATNSLKYGALSVSSRKQDFARVLLDQNIAIVWTERGGPPVSDAAGAGSFGSKMVPGVCRRNLAEP